GGSYLMSPLQLIIPGTDMANIDARLISSKSSLASLFPENAPVLCLSRRSALGYVTSIKGNNVVVEVVDETSSDINSGVFDVMKTIAPPAYYWGEDVCKSVGINKDMLALLSGSFRCGAGKAKG